MNAPKTWITLDEQNILLWYRLVDFELNEQNTVQVLMACTRNLKDDTLTMVMRQRYPDNTSNGVYAYPLDVIMCVQKSDEFLKGMAESGFVILSDSGNVYIPDGVDAIEYLKESVHFNTISKASTEVVEPQDLAGSPEEDDAE